MKRILVIQTASIGDLILATPILECLHFHYPKATIDLLVRKGHETLFRDHPFIAGIMTWDKRSRKYRNLFRLILRIRATGYDQVINCQRFSSTGLLTGLSGAGIRTGFRKNPLSFLFTHRMHHVFREETHEVTRNLSLLGKGQEGCTSRPRLYPSLNDRKNIAPFLRETYYTISPASLWFTKQYPSDRWIELIKHVAAGMRVYLLGSGADVALCDQIATASGNPEIINLAGKLNLLESAALMESARMNFTNDSAPMHLASAVNAPVTAIFCSTLPSFGFGPLSDDSFVAEIRQPLSCRPCGIHGLRNCPEGHFRCACNIPVEQLTSRL